LDVTVWTVLIAALATALATGLGALPFLVVPEMSRLWLGVSNAVAGGVMLGASVGLIREGATYGVARTAGGAAAGVVFIVAVRRLLAGREELAVGTLRGADALKAFMIVAVMTAHSFTEGVGIGVAYGGGEALGALITVAIAVPNIPEGLAISLVLVPRGVSVRDAAGWSVFSSLPQPLMAVPAFVFVEVFEPILPAGLGFAAGAMLWMVAAELLPDALAEAPAKAVALAGAISFAAMIVFQDLVL
jgi:zinc transporter, ZIP family